MFTSIIMDVPYPVGMNGWILSLPAGRDMQGHPIHIESGLLQGFGERRMGVDRLGDVLRCAF